jgi:AraC-like DNA-binding protein
MNITSNTDKMNLKVFSPPEQLQPFIKCYWFSQSRYTDYITDVFFPDGSVEIVFHAGIDFFRNNEKESSSKILGQITRPLTMKARGEGRSFGIWFLPHAFHSVAKIPVNSLNDRAISLDTFFSKTFIDSVNNCIFENSIEDLLAQVNSYFTGLLNISANPERDKIAAYAVNYILRKKAEADLDKLSGECNISNRYLQKIFLEKIGYGPKYFIKIVRFQHALHLLSGERTDSLTSLAYRAGYFDQAHFIRDFKQFTGFTPSQFSLSKSPINQHFLNL